MRLIIGLGNPGQEYARTRHNVGFLVLDELANRTRAKFRPSENLKGDVAEITLNSARAILLKPNTFMNLSGEAVKLAMKKYSIEPQDLLVVFDDADLPLGEMRQTGNGSGGHNGMKSILQIFPEGTLVPRLRVGIGRPHEVQIQLDTWVLGKWSTEEEAKLPSLIKAAADRISINNPLPPLQP